YTYFSIFALVTDIILLFFVVITPSYLQTKTIPFNTYYAIFFSAWILISLTSGKYKFTNQRLKNELMAICINAIAVWGLLSLYVISLEKYNKNYSALYAQILIVVVIELCSRLIYYIINRKKYSRKKESFTSYLNLRNKKWVMMFINLLSVFVAFMIVIWIKPASLRIYLPNYYKFLIALLVWEFLINLITQKNQIKGKTRYRDYIIPILKFNAFTLVIIAIFVNLFRLFNLSRLIIFGTVILSTFFEILFISYIGAHRKIARNTDQSGRIFGVTPFDEKTPRENDYKLTPIPDLQDEDQSIKDVLKDRLLICGLKLYDFIDKHINLKGIYQKELTVFDTQILFNVEAINVNSKKLFINLHKVNDFKRMNDYLKASNDKIEMGGYIIGCGETIQGVYKKFMDQYSRSIALLFYFIHFIFRRVLPKLPITQEINYIITGGQNRTMSKTEILGRLVYSGFKIIDTTEINNLLYFIAIKVNIPYEEENPSYGPFISLKRIGKNGKIIKIYKFRTMHPYSEYIQDYVFEKSHLAKGGKLKDD
ncbi:MAG: sugar transferase, partial [Candidatus Marinimicrobia bacterium]|nr:sugar transferase [Candidatus Neomarinimicrobiota bacterium]